MNASMKIEDVKTHKAWYKHKLAAMQVNETSLFSKDSAPLIDLLAWDLNLLFFHVQCEILKHRLHWFCNA